MSVAGRRFASALGLAVAVACAWSAAAAAQPAGDVERGQRVFVIKQCAHCHRSAEPKGVGPLLDALQRPQGAYELSGRLWNHAPAMFTVLLQEGLSWPGISEPEMSDLMAYLKADPARDPKPDPRRGQVLLVGKGCLKCHAFRREGARIAPDLADMTDDYAPPSRWASRMWAHTPRISQKAIELGIPYPRFTDDEMTHLLGFLRTGRPAR